MLEQTYNTSLVEVEDHMEMYQASYEVPVALPVVTTAVQVPVPMPLPVPVQMPRDFIPVPFPYQPLDPRLRGM